MTKTIIILLQSLYELNREDETDFNKSLKNNFIKHLTKEFTKEELKFITIEASRLYFNQEVINYKDEDCDQNCKEFIDTLTIILS